MSSEAGLLQTHGEALRAIRKKDRRTAADVARYAGMSAQHLYNAESGQRNIDREKLERIAEILGVPVAAITCRCAHGLATSSPASAAVAA